MYVCGNCKAFITLTLIFLNEIKRYMNTTQHKQSFLPSMIIGFFYYIFEKLKRKNGKWKQLLWQKGLDLDTFLIPNNLKTWQIRRC